MQRVLACAVLTLAVCTIANGNGYQLRIVPASKAALQKTISANVPFTTPLEIELLDNYGDRLTAGPFSDTYLAFRSEPDACFTPDARAIMSSGLARFEGSFCRPVTGLVLVFSMPPSVLPLPEAEPTPPIDVVADLYLANFLPDNLGLNGKIETFMMGAIQDINDGYYGDPPYKSLLDDTEAGSYGRRQLHMSTRYTQHTPAGAIKAYNNLKENEKVNPHEKPVSVIGFGNNQITKVMGPLTTMDGLALISHSGDTLPEFSDKMVYPYFNRLVFSDMNIYNGFMLFLASRKWTQIILINSQQSDVSSDFYEAAKTYNVVIVQQFTVSSVGDYSTEPAGRFQNLFSSIKDVGINLIVTTVKGPTAGYMYMEAIDANVTSAQGYQWVGFSNEADFPAGNAPLRCHAVPYCNYALQGMMFNEPLYLVDGFGTLQWQYVWSRHVRTNSLYYPGTGIDLPQELTREGAAYALSYDAITTVTMAINNILKRFETLTAMKISDEIRMLSYRGLSGQIDFSHTGDRLNYQGRISTLWPSSTLWNDFFGWMVPLGMAEPWDYSMLNEKLTIGYFIMPTLNSTSFTEVKSDGGLEGLIVVSWYGEEQAKTGYIEMNDNYKNLRVYNSVEGLFEMETQLIVDDVFDLMVTRQEVTPNPRTREELVPPPFYCANGCGGNKTDPTNINLYDNGVCVRRGVCSCSQYAPGFYSWSGDSCELPVCNNGCIHGNCISPGNCQCDPGWGNDNCNAAICTSPLCDSVGGNCAGPDICICKAGYFGPGCSSQCTCVNGDCNEGTNGNGLCISCQSPFIGNNCDLSLYTVVLPSVIGFLALVAILIVSAIFFLKRAKLKAALLNTDWIVNWNDVKRFEEMFGRSSMYLSGVSMNKSLAGEKRKQKIANQGTWNGVDIHYQQLERDSVILTDSVRVEVKQMRDMRHVNLISLIGCCIDAPNTSILTEIAPKGSLDDILANEDIQLPWNFRFSLLKDVCRGLDYIQRSEIGSHGRLRTTNCLIDNRWTLKLSGFGLKSFRKDLKNVPPFDPSKTVPPTELPGSDFSGLLWTAPEILRTGVHHIDHVGYGTREGDVFSFGIVITEMCSREHPFHDILLEKGDIVDLIAKRSNPEAMKVWNAHIAKLNMEAGSITRPTLREEDWPKKFEKRKLLKTLMEKCWTEDPNQRNSISNCLADLERIDPQRGELMDRLVKMLEKYSSNLEDIVAQRTKELAKEKQRTEDLVARLLPKSVAEELKQGKRSEAESFDCVSIFFSDIVGFTAIAKASTPLQVVAMLNDMYTVFDSITANFDAYKVETIGDAYMVVSGLPIRNGDNHAGEIATIALHLLAAINDFKISHLPDVQLKLRIGIHSGYVVAGVVGLKMPRYCLFGDTVKAAEKMESGGASLRIHMSDNIAQLLIKLGGYKMEPDGETEIKGGVIKTWWLTGKEGFNKPLPVPPEE